EISERFQIRSITIDDAAVISRHRAAMFRDMGVLPLELMEEMSAMTRDVVADAVARGEYVGWVTASRREPECIVAGAGVQLRRILPFPSAQHGRIQLAQGRQAIVLNVYTEPPFRRLGVARALMEHVLEWARAAGVESLVLHA